MDLFRLSTAALATLLIVVLAGSVAIGVLAGRAMRDRPGTRHETAGVVQGALLGLVGLLLAFGLSMAVGRYESRRALVVQEANDIGTTYLRAQLLAEPESSRSATLLKTTPTPPSKSLMPCPARGPTEKRWRTSSDCRATCGRWRPMP